MPDTFIKIASVTVGSGGASSIDFTSIPSTYTDLCLVLSTRSSESGVIGGYGKITFNSSSSNFSYRDVYGNGASAASTSGSTNVIFLYQGNASTASTFGNASIYVPNYAGSNNKSFSIDTVTENNSTTAYAGLQAGLWSNTAAITAFGIAPSSGTWVQYSTATLYGIKNS